MEKMTNKLPMAFVQASLGDVDKGMLILELAIIKSLAEKVFTLIKASNDDDLKAKVEALIKETIEKRQIF